LEYLWAMESFFGGMRRDLLQMAWRDGRVNLDHPNLQVRHQLLQTLASKRVRRWYHLQKRLQHTIG